MKTKSDCPHCYPAKQRHAFTKTASIIEYYVFNPISIMASWIFPKNYFSRRWKKLKLNALEKNLSRNLIQLVDTVDRSQISNGSLVFWDEAKARGLAIFNLKYQNRHTEHFCLIRDGKKHFYSINPIFLLSDSLPYTSATLYDDKQSLRKFLLKHHLPAPRGSAFISASRAFRYGQVLAYPLVVKPSFSSLSQHVSLNIYSEAELKQGIQIAKQINYKIIVEQQILGEVHRALLLDKSLIACTVRKAGSIVGNGKNTIEQLIEAKNKHPHRGELGQKNATLFKVKITEYLIHCLKEQGVSLNTHLEKGRRIFLSKKMNVGNGADVTEVSAKVHPETQALLEKVHQVLNLPLSGLDFICQDISLSWREQSFAIIESNSLPGVSQHHYPAEGEPVNIAAKIWDFVLKRI